MELTIPAIPAAVIVLLNFFAPYAVAVAVRPEWPTRYKKLVAVIVSAVLAVVVLALAFFGFGVEVPEWPALILVAVSVSQASYDLVLRRSADRLSAATSSPPPQLYGR